MSTSGLVRVFTEQEIEDRRSALPCCHLQVRAHHDDWTRGPGPAA